MMRKCTLSTSCVGRLPVTCRMSVATAITVDGSSGLIASKWITVDITPSRERTLDEVKDQVEAKWRDDQISSRLRTKATEMVQKLDQGGKLADEAAQAGLSVETAAGFKRDASMPGVPAGAIAAAFRTAKDAAGQTLDAAANGWIVFRVTDVTVPPVDLASDDMKKLKDSILRAQTDEQLAQYITKLETEIGTSVNEAALAQVTGTNN